MSDADAAKAYVLEDQIGFRLRLANQRHLEIFAATIPDVTPTQFATLVKLKELGVLSQNHLGRLVAMDAATTNGVVTRLRNKGLVRTQASTNDLRRLEVSLTPEGEAFITEKMAAAHDVSALTMKGLTAREREQILALLAKMAV
ncbi:MarR family transcriptional regulator [Tabrizicola sp. TH137]|uniref:MarR family winged helix-turn-helix transcriptional regulator n=1 Tax=Tabrizicola sp. TH137 TaxID=2067452 RepID=UPI000C7BAEE1|nr:MarR family transcriptional regulator [Tabrizicola sp. TH137]PLL11405.1 MarR family transcriptional regulator [Tabrizicola sp. TH137]